MASIDPTIVLFHDGYVRVGGAKYNESDFSSTSSHLTNHAFRTEDQGEVLPEFLYKRIREHYQQHKDRLSKVIPPGIDPVAHVRNQMKDVVSTLVAAFKDDFFTLNKYPQIDNMTIPTVTAENLFGVYGVDFIIGTYPPSLFLCMQRNLQAMHTQI